MTQVIARLMGGLGNQMFQYATGAALAERLNVPLLLDRSFLDHQPAGMTWTPRTFELDVFAAPIAFATGDQVQEARAPRSWLDRATSRLLPTRFPPRVFHEHGHGFDPAFNDLLAPVYLDGYWQNEQYFNPIAGTLRDRYFVPRQRPDERNLSLRDRMVSSISASVHVRRGDYVSDPGTARYHGACSLEYYSASARSLVRTEGVDHFFVFSDEPAWAEANLALDAPATFVHHNSGRESHWDLWLMRHCKHHIIANSSFSWWGAWLNASPTKTVIAPARWFAGLDVPPHAIVPETWTVR